MWAIAVRFHVKTHGVSSRCLSDTGRSGAMACGWFRSALAAPLWGAWDFTIPKDGLSPNWLGLLLAPIGAAVMHLRRPLRLSASPSMRSVGRERLASSRQRIFGQFVWLSVSASVLSAIWC